jgi:hypothetical protein
MDNTLIIIKLFIYNKDIYNKYINYINKEYIKELNIDIYKLLLVVIDSYNNNINISSIQDLKALYNSAYPTTVVSKPSDSDGIQAVFDKLESLDVSQAVMEQVLEAHKTRYIASQLAEVSWDTSNGKKTLQELRSAFETGFRELETVPVTDNTLDDQFVGDDIDALLDRTYASPGYKFRLKTLRVMMGSLRKGNAGMIFGRPECGKSTLIASEGSYLASQLDRPYLHVNNEESSDAIKLRYIQAALGRTIEEINRNRRKAMDDFLEVTKGNIRIMRDKPAISWQEIEDLCAKLNPGIIVIDSIDKIKGFENDRDDLVYKQIYQWSRELAKKYGPVIGVCHAAVSAEGREWLEMDDVAYAKCLHPDTKVLMYDGSWHKIKDISVGELVMGPDSMPRKVLSTSSGTEEMFKITHKIGGDSYIVNKSHILTLRHQSGDIRDVPLEYYLKYPSGYKGIRSGYSLSEKQLPVDPYWLGLWLGDGHNKRPEITTNDIEIKNYVKDYAEKLGYSYVELRNGANGLVQAKIKGHQGKPHKLLNILKEFNLYGNKHVPELYLKSHENQRLALLAGLIDSDGCLVNKQHYYYEFSNNNENIAYSVKALALSCHFMATLNKYGDNYKVRISGNITKIPCLVKRKICPAHYLPYKKVTDSSLTVEALGIGEYCGFTLDGDNRFIIDNCIVTHNTAKQGEMDWILGIGKSHDKGKEYTRALHLSKNKLMGDEDSLEEFRHGHIRVLIRPEIARYDDIQFKEDA